ncbi:hypothetical protein JNJ66_05125 [Candidatus Saccharibacteria bacterium]|nr:hypothetical protein [Candidatus Saccharibacteria bacterium]
MHSLDERVLIAFPDIIVSGGPQEEPKAFQWDARRTLWLLELVCLLIGGEALLLFSVLINFYNLYDDELQLANSAFEGDVRQLLPWLLGIGVLCLSLSLLLLARRIRTDSPKKESVADLPEQYLLVPRLIMCEWVRLDGLRRLGSERSYLILSVATSAHDAALAAGRLELCLPLIVEALHRHAQQDAAGLRPATAGPEQAPSIPLDTEASRQLQRLHLA